MLVFIRLQRRKFIMTIQSLKTKHTVLGGDARQQHDWSQIKRLATVNWTDGRDWAIINSYLHQDIK